MEKQNNFKYTTNKNIYKQIQNCQDSSHPAYIIMQNKKKKNTTTINPKQVQNKGKTYWLTHRHF